VNARFLIPVCLAGITITAGAKDDASIEGVVQLPPPTVVRALNQRYGTHTEAPLTPSNPPAAVVYIEGALPPKAKPASGAVAQMAQKNMLFAPDLIAIHTGGAVEFPNQDDTYHNVFSYSKAKRFDLGRYRKEEKPGSVIFDKPGVVTVHCEIHDRMRATVLVLDSPYFQKTDSAGHYRMDHLPAGHFTVDLKPGANAHLNFSAK
jgi:plastocyanin